MKKRILLLITSIFLLTGCPIINGDNCSDRSIDHYKFELPIYISPSENQLNLEDTLFVSFKVKQDSVHELFEDEYYDLSEFEYFTNYFLVQIDSFPVLDGLLENDCIIDSSYNHEFIYFSTLSTALLSHVKHDDEYTFIEFYIVLKKPGTYAFYSCSILQDTDQRREIHFDRRCGDGSLITDFKYNTEDVIHEEILSSENIDVIAKFWEHRAGTKSDCEPYYFKVN